VDAALKLTARTSQTLARARVVPTLVIVEDTASYVDAISKWTRELRYPVLLDDGSPQAADNIGRFVRAFEPTAVVRHKADTPALRDPQLIAARVDSAIGRAWGMARPVNVGTDLTDHFRTIGHEPPGIIIANPSDSGWTGALALGAARGQPILWHNTLDRNINATMSLEDARSLQSLTESFCTTNALAWPRLGDTIDAITICANAPIKLHFADPPPGREIEQPTRFALTDLLGRHMSARATEGRWAWAGQVPGDAPAAAYRAMCSLFLSPSRAWVFDSYNEPGIWQTHDGTQARNALTKAGWSVRLDDAPDAGTLQWKGVASRPLDAELIFVTTMGNAGFFDLGRNDRAFPGELPILDRPTILHFVHSWSLSAPAAPNTVGARWLERGVYAYAGSVQEPFLSAFVPTPMVAQRLMAGMPWGAAVRLDEGAVWRIAVLGDPLLTIGGVPRPARAAGDIPLDGSATLDAELREAVQKREFERALRLMTLLARDQDAARLAAAILRDESATLSPEAALYSVLPAFRAQDLDLALSVHQRLSAKEAATTRVGDPLWNLARFEVDRAPPELRERALDVLAVSIRPLQKAQDGVEVTRWLSRHRGRAAAQAMANTLRPDFKAQADLRALDAAIEGR
jgi:hypothetical protein